MSLMPPLGSARAVAPAVLLFAVTACTPDPAPTDLPLIPHPAEVVEGAGEWTMGPETVLAVSGGDDATRVVDAWAGSVRGATGWALDIVSGTEAPARAIRVSLTGGDDDPEGYRLDVSPGGVALSAATPAGIFYGLQTLSQLLPDAGGGATLALPAVEIRDRPRFPYRGMHLDVGRHFFGPEFVKRYIDLLARYKINRFHWHLTEDQGWRIEIDRYPRLTEVAAYRAETMVEKHFDPYVGDGRPYGGYYTQEEIRDVVAYARDRFVTIVPEIELPGHSSAAVAAYPELGCTDDPVEVATTWGVFDDIYCPKEETFTFLENVLTEVMELFPGEYVHIGGDEAPKTRWKESPLAQEVMAREGLADEHELQSWFIRRIEGFLNEHGRRLIGWDEILEGGLAETATVMSWRGTSGGIEAARLGRDVIMTPYSHLYFDYYQGDPEDEPLAIGGYLPLETVYGFEPIPDELDEAEARHILGAQANVWTEYIPTEEHVEYMAFPRALALAEMVWSPAGLRTWDGFAARLPRRLAELDRLGVNYRIPDVFGVGPDRVADSATEILEVGSPAPGAVHYTLDGSDPTGASPTAGTTPGNGTASITVSVNPETVRVAARAILPDGRMGPVSRATLYPLTALAEGPRVDSAALEPGLELVVRRGRVASTHAAAPDGNGDAGSDGGERHRSGSLTGDAVFDGTTTEIGLPGDAPDTDFTALFQGFIRVPEDGAYSFRLTSDDGAVLRVGGEVVVDHDGVHYASQRQGSVALRAGLHPFELRYFQVAGRRRLSLSVSREGAPHGPVPPEWLFRERGQSQP